MKEPTITNKNERSGAISEKKNISHSKHILKKVIWILLLITFMVADLFFIVPLYVKHVWNIGTATGIGVCTIAFLCTLFSKPLGHLIGHMWRYILGKIVIVLVSAIIVCILGLASVETILMINAAHKKAPENPTVVVLGCKAFGYNPSNMLWKRLECALEYLQEHPEAVAVLSGGQGSDEVVSEAECMRAWLVSRGIDENRLYLEDRSTSTEENLAFTKELILAEGLNSDIVIITNEFHQYRAGKYAQAQGLNYGACSAPSAFGLGPIYYVRELYGILHNWWLE